jgi:plastocyanin
MPSLLHASAGHPLRPALAIRAALALLFAVLLAGACQAAAPSGPVATNQVDLPRSYKFAPADITVPTGTTVTWTNNDNFTHTVRLLDSGEDQMLRPGETVTHVFTDPGLFRYDCSLHPKDMKGSVLVAAGPGGTP